MSVHAPSASGSGRKPVTLHGLRALQARELAQAGSAMLVLELMPGEVASQVQADNPQLITIGIGAGAGTAGQMLVMHDMPGLTRSRLPRFVRNFARDEQGAPVDTATALATYVRDVKGARFPDPQLHGYARA